MTWVFVQDGVPILYYGQEQGYAGGNDPNNREAYVPRHTLSTNPLTRCGAGSGSRATKRTTRSSSTSARSTQPAKPPSHGTTRPSCTHPYVPPPLPSPRISRSWVGAVPRSLRLPARPRERAPPRAAHERGRLRLAAMVRREHELHQGRGAHRRGELRDDEGRRGRRGVVDEPGGHACGTSLSLRIGRPLTSGVCRCCSRRRYLM